MRGSVRLNPISNNRSQHDFHTPNWTCTHTSKLAPKATRKLPTRKVIAKNHFFLEKVIFFCIHSQKSKFTIANQYFTCLNSDRCDFRSTEKQYKKKRSQLTTGQMQNSMTNGWVLLCREILYARKLYQKVSLTVFTKKKKTKPNIQKIDAFCKKNYEFVGWFDFFLSIPVLIKPQNTETSSPSKLVTTGWYVFLGLRETKRPTFFDIAQKFGFCSYIIQVKCTYYQTIGCFMIAINWLLLLW